jgi:DNA-binding LytR/AlgR family response regulator
MIRIVIIEDERLIAEELKQRILMLSNESTVKAILPSVQEAITYLSANNDIDLVFSDIQLPDGLSFDIFSEVTCNLPVVFITAYDQYIVNAFEHNGIDYLLKPVDDSDIVKVLGKYRMLGDHFSNRQQFYNLFATARKRIMVKKGLMSVSLKLEDVVLFYTENKVVYTIDKEGRKYVCEQNLSLLEDALGNTGFFRANRQFLINAEYIRGYRTYDKVKLMVDLAVPVTDQLIIISQETAPSFRRWMNEI